MDGTMQTGPRARVCSCLQCLYGPYASHPYDGGSAVGIWRPWLVSPKDIEREQRRRMATPNLSDSEQAQQTPTGDKVPAFRHPVKLFWPKSKCFDYLYEDAAHLLANFPVQATISFYQESDSESESDDSN
ncbi:protein ripply1-like [Heterodontus francisci]|uniref:protein ripply1-like n=1 Tax=Heterodontus francisci TaxID=7792 RepID=UPI00355ADEDA